MTKHCVTYFVFWGFSFKVSDTAWIMPNFGEQFILVNFYWWF